MYCPNCGQKISDDFNFCWRCGARLQHPYPVRNPNQNYTNPSDPFVDNQNYANPSDHVTKKSKENKLILLVMLICTFLIVGIIWQICDIAKINMALPAYSVLNENLLY